ncbi:MAG: hypothetical protein L6W00_15620 [Lentisphaeria bacterium]|nr:MAG: hypothetical protein L6W00_15620 [Lentisphaeria bacterium]
MRSSIEFATRSPAVLPPIGNGELSLQIDPEGAMSPEFGLKSICHVSNWRGMIPGIRRAGWRWGEITVPGENCSRSVFSPRSCPAGASRAAAD